VRSARCPRWPQRAAAASPCTFARA
jgi:hypothetical protein